jgi:hypothetical protein
MRLLFSSVISALLLGAATAHAHDQPCSAAKRQEVLARATEDAQSVNLDCKLVLSGTETITKRLRFVGEAASNASLECHGALIDPIFDRVRLGVEEGKKTPALSVVSKKLSSDACTANPRNCAYSRPQNITIKGCRVVGTVSVHGVSDAHALSRREDYVTFARSVSPRNITFESLEINADNGDDMFYVYPGSTRVRLLDSELRGQVRNVAIYLDAETSENTLDNNLIAVRSEKRELLAIDGSNKNTIINNVFADKNHDFTRGPLIRLYRNCGERGTIRHTTPSSNKIINNKFLQAPGEAGFAVHLGSRNRDNDDSFCDEDNGFPFGSSADDKDNATNNIVMQNQFFNHDPDDMVAVGRPQSDSGNVIEHNQRVEHSIRRDAGCYVSKGYSSLASDGEEPSVIRMTEVGLTCTTFRCDNSVLTEIASCEPETVAFDCSQGSDNDGCDGTATCPSGTVVIGATAACNLERTSVSADDVNDTPAGKIKVIEQSDHVSEGSCYVGSRAISSGEAQVRGTPNRRSAPIGCQEHDGNGGDCRIRGRLYCL